MKPIHAQPIDDDLPQPLSLPDGRTISFGLVSPADQALIQAGVGRMSELTSTRRFFSVRHQLSELELHRLTDMDGWDRFAIGAAARSADGHVEGVGVARFHRVADQPDAAEMALVVVDAFQGQGIGKQLLDALCRAARKRGIDRLRGSVLRDNAPMLGLLTRHAPGALQVTQSPGEDVDFELQLDCQRTSMSGTRAATPSPNSVR